MKPTQCKILVLFVVCFATPLFSDDPPSSFQTPFVVKIEGGGTVIDAIQTKDGNYAYLTLALNDGPGMTQVMNASGKTISEISMLHGFDTVLGGMAQTSNGFALVGWYREDYEALAKAVVFIVNSDGKVQRNQYKASGHAVYLHSVISTADGGFIATGDQNVIKFSSQGDVLWAKTFDSGFSAFSLSTPTLDGGIILAFRSHQGGVGVIKIGGSGNTIWAVTLKMKEFRLQSLTSLSDQRYVIAGKATHSNRLLLVTLNADGTVHSKAAYSLKVRDFYVTGLAQTPHHGLAIAGDLITKSGRRYAGFFLKINKHQQLALKKKLGFGNGAETITSVIAQEDGSFLLFGSNGLDRSDDRSDTLLIGLNRHGSVPGCNFSEDFRASKVLFGSLEHQSLTITPRDLRLRVDEKLDLTSISLNREILNVCVN